MQTPSTIPADPSSIARRILAISEIVQTTGIFRRFATLDEGEMESLDVAFGQAEPEVILMPGDHMVAKLGFQCVVSKPGADVRELVAHAEDAEPPAGLRCIVEGVFLVRYTLAPGTAPSPDELAAFGRINAPLNVVPYWREYLDSSLRRTGLPPIMAPVHRTEPSGAIQPSPAAPPVAAQ